MLFKNVILNSRMAFRLWQTDGSLQLTGRIAIWEIRSRTIIPDLQDVEFASTISVPFPNVSVSYRPVVPKS
jgi:hypothetical protein